MGMLYQNNIFMKQLMRIVYDSRNLANLDRVTITIVYAATTSQKVETGGKK